MNRFRLIDKVSMYVHVPLCSGTCTYLYALNRPRYMHVPQSYINASSSCTYQCTSQLCSYMDPVSPPRIHPNYNCRIRNQQKHIPILVRQSTLEYFFLFLQTVQFILVLGWSGDCETTDRLAFLHYTQYLLSKIHDWHIKQNELLKYAQLF